MKRVAAVVVTYNRKELLEECIDALLHQTYNDCDIIVVDNASTDGTQEFINQKYKDLVIYQNTGSNLGGAGGFNYGVKTAYTLGYEYFWLMDDDCIVDSDSLSVLMNTANELKDDFGFLSSRVLWKDGSLCKMNIQKISYKQKIDENIVGLNKIIMATFVSFLVKRTVVEAVGLPISDFFIWADDLEYSRRISKNHNCYYVFNSKVTHKSKSNIGSDLAIDETGNFSRYRFAYRNEYYLFRNEGLKGKLYYFTKRMYHRIKIIRNGKNVSEKLKVISNAIKEGKGFYPQVEFVDQK